MPSTSRRSLVLFVALLALLALLGSTRPARAQCSGPTCHTVSGALSDATTGPLLSGHTYLFSGQVQVPQGTTLTIEPGAVIKTQHAFASLTVSGVLLCAGTPAQPIVFTSFKDDSVGGDTNGDGSLSSPAPSDMANITFGSTAVGSVVANTEFRYGGGPSGGPTLAIDAAGVPLTNVLVRDGNGDGVSLSVVPGPVQGCQVERCARPFVVDAPSALSQFSGNTSSDNALGEVIHVRKAGGVSGVTTWGSAVRLNGTGALSFANKVTVNAGATLVWEPGLVLAMTHVFSAFAVKGTLIAEGTAADPIVVTSVEDDAYGGDLGSGTAAPGQWDFVDLQDTAGASRLRHVLLRFGGSGNQGLLRTSCDAILEDCTFEASSGDGLSIVLGSPQLTNCHFADNADRPIDGLSLAKLGGLSGNTASGNGSGDAVVLGGGTLSVDATLSASAAFNGTGAFAVASTIFVDSSATLTVAPGVVVKFDPATSARLDVLGVLLCQGTPVAPVTFTSLRDDSVGGDLNGDGSASSPAPGDWPGLRLLHTADASVLDSARVRYAGSGGSASVSLTNCDASLTGCAIELGLGPALDANGGSRPILTACAFDACGGVAPLVELPLDGVPGVVACTASGNALSNSLRVSTATITGALALSVANTLNQDGVFVVDGALSVATTGVLELEAGIVVKFAGAHAFTVVGRIVCAGTAGDPVVITDLSDDWGGDTDGDRGPPSQGTPGTWRQLSISGSLGSVLTHTRVRNAGFLSLPSVLASGTDARFEHVVVERGLGAGMSLASGATPTVTGCAFDDNARPLEGVTVGVLAGFSENTAAGNAQGDVLRLSGMGSQPVGGFVLEAASALNGDGVFFVAGGLDVNFGQRLTVGPGVVLEFAAPSLDLYVNGVLDMDGSVVAPIVLTSIHDDDFGGADGDPTAPQPGDWSGLTFDFASDESTLDHVVVRYAGYLGEPTFDLSDADITLCDVLIEHGLGDAIDTNSNSAPTLKNVQIEDNGGAPIEGLTWNVVGSMLGVEAHGNGSDLDATVIESPLVKGDVTIDEENVLGSCIVVMVTPDVSSSDTLSFGRGVIVKAGMPDVALPVKAIRGTGLEKAVFTSIFDDAWGGDTNGDGAATTALPGDWIGVSCSDEIVEHALIRFAGGDPGVVGQERAGLRGTVDLVRSVRVEYSAGHGVWTIGLQQLYLGVCESVVAFANAGHGIVTLAANNCTSVANLGFGIDASKARYCIAFKNGVGGAQNYTYTSDTVLGPHGSNVVWSIGTSLGVAPPGGPFDNCPNAGWGNALVNPLFVDWVAGDLRLAANSPARNYALVPCPASILDDVGLCKPWGLSGQGYPDPPAASRDHLEHPRRVDDDLAGPAGRVADLGAYERVLHTLAVDDEETLGAPFTLTVQGPPGTAQLLLGLPTDVDAYLANYGWLMMNADVFFVIASVPVGSPVQFALPDDPVLHGLELALQAAVTPTGAFSNRQLTNVFRPRFHL